MVAAVSIGISPSSNDLRLFDLWSSAPDAPVLMRTSGEIDAYPGNIREWEANNPGELASEEINALFGWGSLFHEEYGFYIDGVDENTALLPDGWQSRANSTSVAVDGVFVTALAPSASR